MADMNRDLAPISVSSANLSARGGGRKTSKLDSWSRHPPDGIHDGRDKSKLVFHRNSIFCFVAGALAASMAYNGWQYIHVYKTGNPALSGITGDLPWSSLAPRLAAAPGSTTAAAAAAVNGDPSWDDLPFLRQHNEQTPFVFVHIPKAAGTTITENFKKAFRKTCSEVAFKKPTGMDAILADADKFKRIVMKYTEMGGIGLNSAVDRAKNLHNIPCYFGHAVAGPRFNARAMMAESVLHQGARYRYILGHVPFGYCNFAEKGCVHVTVLREPISRIQSHYGYLQRVHPDIIYKMCKGKCNDFASFTRLIAGGSIGTHGLDNMQTRMIYGESFWSSATKDATCFSGLDSCDSIPPRMVSEMHLQTAIDNLNNHFAVVGVMEQLPLFSKAINTVFKLNTGDTVQKNSSWTKGQFLNANPNASLSDPNYLDPETKRIISEFLAHDIALYNHALKIVAKQEAELSNGRPLPLPDGYKVLKPAQTEQDEKDRAVAEALNI